jgi:hypothetical protein
MLDDHYMLEQGSEAPLQWRKSCKDVTQPTGLTLEFIFLSTSCIAHHNEGSCHTLSVFMKDVCRPVWEVILVGETVYT